MSTSEIHRITVRPAPELGFRSGELSYYVVPLPGDRVSLRRAPDDTGGIIMPRASLPHFVHDLEGRVDLPRSRVPQIDAVVTGNAELLGKGDDGLVFRVGDEVVKVSTTVPFQPENSPHISPAEALERLREQTKMHNVVAELGGADHAVFYVHGDKGFQIKPYVVIPEKFSQAQLDAVQLILIRLHNHKIVLRDKIQPGIDQEGHVKLFDVGKSEPVSSSAKRYTWSSQYEIDYENLEDLYRESGVTFIDLDPVRRKIEEKKQARERAFLKKR